MGIFAPRHSGKTNLVINILRRWRGPDTKFIALIGSGDRDDKWGEFLETNEDRTFVSHSLVDEDSGDNILKSFMEGGFDEDLGGSAMEEVPVQRQPQPDTYVEALQGKTTVRESGPEYVDVKDPEGKDKKRTKYKYPKYVIVMDDLADEARNKYVGRIYKKLRHYKSSVITSCQAVTDVLPSTLNNMQFVIIFGNLPLEKVEDLYKKLNLRISKEKFLQIYKLAARPEEHSFLYIDREHGKFRKNFNELIRV